jgi:hypothetical protein
MNGNILTYVDEMNRCKYSIYIILFISALRINSVYSQELEPRALTNIPVGMNFVVAGYAYSQGNLLFDPALPLEDTDAKLHMLIGAYARSINFFGLSGKMDLIVPYGSWRLDRSIYRDRYSHFEIGIWGSKISTFLQFSWCSSIESE